MSDPQFRWVECFLNKLLLNLFLALWVVIKQQWITDLCLSELNAIIRIQLKEYTVQKYDFYGFLLKGWKLSISWTVIARRLKLLNKVWCLYCDGFYYQSRPQYNQTSNKYSWMTKMLVLRRIETAIFRV